MNCWVTRSWRSGRYLYSSPWSRPAPSEAGAIALRRGLVNPMPAGAYLLKARKRVYTLTPVRLRFREKAPRARQPREAHLTLASVSTVEIYTDGACRGNPGPGGWAALLSVDGQEKEISGAEALTTNNRMELTAVIRALEALRRPVRVRVYTDSQYVRRGITEWLAQWKKRGWLTADRKPVKNQDLWERLEEICRGSRHRVALGSRTRRCAGQ